MVKPLNPNAVVNICRNCIPKAEELPRQLNLDGVHILVRTLPCSGKIDGQYMLHTLEDVTHGLCVITCPAGKCHLAQGNFRAQVRVGTIRRLLEEVGLEPERAQLITCPPEKSVEQIEQLIRESVQKLIKLGPSSLHSDAGNREVRKIEVATDTGRTNEVQTRKEHPFSTTLSA